MNPAVLRLATVKPVDDCVVVVIDATDLHVLRKVYHAREARDGLEDGIR